ncbi:ABC transporter ATP-binding protein [Lutispora thermophila]|uniref:ATP-binding cassette, subfamily B n=1 Tax=Lutispora thermophila DSM 19022 TaxID=1122184 RepID=A0A1M6E3T6_9FIRM|nr:ABC transporter ATP-binding protein [Lutispora thermophila]SHI80065.1 ATP-binding cassette, subfamily B [Lutispora thermophila DSM 19022]
MNNFHEEEVVVKTFDTQLLKRLLKYAKPYVGLICTSFLLLILITLGDLARPYLMKIAIDDYIAVGNKDGLKNIALIFVAVITGSFACNYIQVYILNYTGQKIIYNMRQELYSHLLRMSLSFYDRNPVGRLVTRVSNDMENLNEMYTTVLVNLFKDIFTLTGIVIVMLRMNAKVALISFIAIPFIFLSALIFRKESRKAYRVTRVKLAKINATLSENISGMKIIQIFNREKYKYDEFFAINDEHRQASLREVFVFAIFRPSMDLIYSFSLALLIWYGGGRVLQGALPFGVLFAFVNYIDQFFKPINDLTEKFDILQSAMSSAERIFMLLDQEEEIKNIESPKSLGKVIGKIEFKNVWFAYEGENWVLKDVSFTINPGETVAFVGATSAGKTSIISLIARLYDIQKGEILIDGKNIKEVDKYELRSHIGVVLQDVFLFTGDIKGNIRLNNQNIDDEKIKEVAGFVNADTFIENLPNKYDEKVMERGATLSSGQRQLLAFARALAFNPSVLVLDEATSNIDTETELLIQDAIKKLIKGRTNIIIAHRLSTIQNADKIIVMHKGKIREMGKHQELLDKKGMYYDLYLLQYKE